MYTADVKKSLRIWKECETTCSLYEIPEKSLNIWEMVWYAWTSRANKFSKRDLGYQKRDFIPSQTIIARPANATAPRVSPAISTRPAAPVERATVALAVEDESEDPDDPVEDAFAAFPAGAVAMPVAAPDPDLETAVLTDAAPT